MDNMYESIGKINSWANSLLRNTLEIQNDDFFSIETPYGLVGDIIAHLFDAINLWINRIENKEPSRYIRRLHDFDTINQLFLEWKSTDLRLEKFISRCIKENTINDRISYKTMKGKHYNNSIKEILFHISHHGYQHRSQLAMLLRQLEKEPMLPQDAIFYFRENKG